MREPSNPQNKSELTRAKIAKSALTLFRRRGFDATTMRDIAKHAGVALGSAYYYFASKEALVAAYYEDTQSAHEALSLEKMAGASDVQSRLAVVLHTKFDVLQKDRKLLGAIFKRVGEPGDPLSPFGESTRGIRERSLRQFEQALGDDIADPQLKSLVVQALWSLHMGLLLYFLHDPSPEQEKTRKLIDASLVLVTQMIQMAPMMGAVTEPLAAMLRDAKLIG